MCGGPSYEEPETRRVSKEPVYRTSATSTLATSTGRRGTILTGASDAEDQESTGKKTLLGA